MKHIFPATIIAVVLAGCASSTPLKKMSERHNIGDYIYDGKTIPHTFNASNNPHPLPFVQTGTASLVSNQRAIKDVEKYLDRFDATTALILIEDGKILHEAYRGMGRPTSEFYSMSIGKSMTSLAVGKALCNGLIPSLDTKAGDLVPELNSSGFGRSTIRQLLTMSSGAYKSYRSGQPRYKNGIGYNLRTQKPFTGHTWPIRLGQASVSEILWGKWWEAAMYKAPNAPGEIFNYKAGDTLSLSKIVERVSGKSLAAYFDEHIWQQIGAEKTGHWEADTEGSTLASAGFQASLRDWARIAIWILEARQKEDCYGNYLRAATTTQIPLPYNKRSSFSGYGYQWWTKTSLAPGFWGIGYAGQFLALNPATHKILIKFSYRYDPKSGLELLRLFNKWQEQ